MESQIISLQNEKNELNETTSELVNSMVIETLKGYPENVVKLGDKQYQEMKKKSKK